jgi:hypothetical protein
MFPEMFESSAGQPSVARTSSIATGCSARSQNTGSRFSRFQTRMLRSSKSSEAAARGPLASSSAAR